MLANSHLIGFEAAGSEFTVTINTADTTLTAQNFTFVDRSTAVLPSALVTKIGFFSNTARTVTVKIVKRNSANNYDVVVTQAFAHAGTGWQDFTITTPYSVPATGTYYLAGYVPSGGANPDCKNTSGARAYINSDLTGTGVATTGEDTTSTFPMRYTYLG